MIDAALAPKLFMGLWLPALAVSAAVPAPAPRLGDLFVVDLGGLPVPVVTCALAALGILLSRPFVWRRETEIGWPLKLLVSAILLIVAQLWVIESHPGWLFAFVVSIGLGFAGYSLLELFGDEAKDFVRDVFARARATIGLGPGKDGQ